MPELPEVQAHCERLERDLGGTPLVSFEPLAFTVLKTAAPSASLAEGTPLGAVSRRGKYLLLHFPALTFAVHLMQAGRLVPVAADTRPPKHAQARWTFSNGRSLLLTEAGRERKAGVWCITDVTGPPLQRLGPDALDATAAQLSDAFADTNMRLHNFLRDQHHIAGLGRMLANEVCFRARLSPFAMTRTLTPDEVQRVADAIEQCIADGLAHERTRTDMSATADRPGAVHQRVGAPCHVCTATIASVRYSGYTVAYCPTCQTGGHTLADNTTSRFLK